MISRHSCPVQMAFAHGKVDNLSHGKSYRLWDSVALCLCFLFVSANLVSAPFRTANFVFNTYVNIPISLSHTRIYNKVYHSYYSSSPTDEVERGLLPSYLQRRLYGSGYCHPVVVEKTEWHDCKWAQDLRDAKQKQSTRIITNKERRTPYEFR